MPTSLSALSSQLSALSSQSSVMDGGGFGRGRGGGGFGRGGGGRGGGHPGVADSRVGWQGPPGGGVGHPDSGFLTRNQLDSHLRGLNYIPYSGKGMKGWGFHEPGPKMWNCAVCRAQSFMHRMECFKCSTPRPVLKNVKPVKTEICACGCGQVVDHGSCGTEVSFFDLPMEVFVPLILRGETQVPGKAMPIEHGTPLSVADICSLSQVDKGCKAFFDENAIWRYFFVREKVKIFYPKKVKALTQQKVRKNSTMSWSRDEIQQNRCTLIVKNQTKSIPMDVYWVTGAQGSKKMSKKAPIKPGDNFITQTYPNHKWFCVPTEEWLLDNPCSNVGFSFVVNVLELTEHQFEKTKKLAFVRKFHEPKDLKPIKNAGKDYASVKEEYMKLVLNHQKLANAFRSNHSKKHTMNKEVQRLSKTLKAYQRQLQEMQKKEKAIMHAQKVVKQK